MDRQSSFSEELRQKRRAAGLTQEALAESSGISPRAITNLERGVVQVPRRETVDLLADALELKSEERYRWQSLRRQLSVRASTSSSSRPAESNLPSPPNALIGRDGEVDELTTMIQTPEIGLVTVTGPGGVGKTRVAIEAARRLKPAFRDGAFFADLAPLRDPRQVLSAIAEQLELRDVQERNIQERLTTYLARRNVLLVLDNFEHLLAAATGISRLLTEKTCSRILVTSRARLQIQAEHEFPVASLTLPNANAGASSEEIGQYPGVQLFAERARQVNPDFALTADNALDILTVCVHLDGLPLAIELAAARTRVLPPSVLRSRLVHRLYYLTRGFRDGPDRHRTMRDAITWSYELLNTEEQRLFRQLATFVGGWSLEAAERVNPSTLGALDGLESLLDNNLIYRETLPDAEARFSMLETIREFGLDELKESDEIEAARATHADYYLGLVEETEPHLRGPDPKPWLDRIEIELANFRSALDWADGTAVGEQYGLRLSSALSWYWFRLHGDVSEGRRLISRTLTRAPGKTGPRMKALAGLAWQAHMQRDSEAARDAALECLEIARDLNDDWYTVWSLHLLGRVAYFDDDPPTAYSYGQQSLDLALTLGDDWLIAWVYQLLGISRFIGYELETARKYLETSLDLWQRLDDQPGIAALHALLGVVTRREGDYQGALSLFQHSLLVYRSLGARWFAANFIAEVVALAVLLDEPRRAARLSGFVDEGWNLIGAGPAPFTEQTYGDARSIIYQSLTSAEYESARSAGQRMSLDEAIDEALLVGQQSGDGV